MRLNDERFGAALVFTRPVLINGILGVGGRRDLQGGLQFAKAKVSCGFGDQIPALGVAISDNDVPTSGKPVLVEGGLGAQHLE